MVTDTLERARTSSPDVRRCTADSPFDEMAAAARRYDLGVLRVARALVRLSDDANPERDSFATAVARYEWGALPRDRKSG